MSDKSDTQRTHFADDDTLAYIGRLGIELAEKDAALRKAERELAEKDAALNVEKIEHANFEAKYLNMRERAEKAEAERDELLHERSIETLAYEQIKAERESFREALKRNGCPYVTSVVSDEGGYSIAHEILHAIPTAGGLKVIIAPTKSTAIARKEGA